jgi:hypothetical protein
VDYRLQTARSESGRAKEPFHSFAIYVGLEMMPEIVREPYIACFLKIRGPYSDGGGCTVLL